MPFTAEDLTQELREAGFEAEYTKDQLRYAPHVIFLKQLERLDQSMAALKDPYPAFLAWKSGLMAWAAEDPAFWDDYDSVREIERELFAEYGAIPVIQYVAMWRPVYIRVMRRAGMFHGDSGTMPPTPANSGREEPPAKRLISLKKPAPDVSS